MGIMMGVVSFILGLCINLLDAAAMALLDAISYDLNTFTAIFPFAQNAAYIFQACGLAFLMLGFVWNIFKGFGTPFGVEAENPIALVAKFGLTWAIVVNSQDLINLIISFFKIILSDLQSIPAGTYTATKIVGSLVNSILMSISGIGAVAYIIIALVLGWKFIKLLLEIVERYVVYCFIVFIAPVFLATAAFKSTRQTAETWFRAFMGQSLLIILNFWSVKMFFSGVQSLNGGSLASGEPTLLMLFMIIAFLNFAMKIDSFLRILGLNTAHTGSDLGQGLMNAGMKVFALTKSIQGITGSATKGYEAATRALGGGVGMAGTAGAAGRNGGSGANTRSNSSSTTTGSFGVGTPGASETAAPGTSSSTANGGVGAGGQTGTGIPGAPGGASRGGAGGVFQTIMGGRTANGGSRSVPGMVGDLLGFGAMNQARSDYEAAKAAHQANAIDYSGSTGLGSSGLRGMDRSRHAGEELHSVARNAGQAVTENGVGATNRYENPSDKVRLMNAAVSMTAGYQQEMHDRSLGLGCFGQIRQEMLASSGARAVASNAELYTDGGGNLKPVVSYEGADAAAAMNGVLAFDNPNVNSFTTTSETDDSGQHGISGMKFNDGSYVTWDGLENGVATGVYTDAEGNSTGFNLVHDNAVATQNMFAAEGREGFTEFDSSKSIGKVGDGSGTSGYHVLPRAASDEGDAKVPYGRSTSYSTMGASVDVSSTEEVRHASERLKGLINNVHAPNYVASHAKTGVEQVRERTRGAGPRTKSDTQFQHNQI
jgi:hypothetical protein